MKLKNRSDLDEMFSETNTWLVSNGLQPEKLETDGLFQTWFVMWNIKWMYDSYKEYGPHVKCLRAAGII